MASKTKTKPALKTGRFYLPPVELKLADGSSFQTVINQKVELIRCGTFFHEQYGKLEITPVILKSFVKNFNEKARRIDLAVDYKHNSEDVAAGWIKNIYFDENSGALYAEIDWTSNGKRVLVDKEFRYVSAEFNLDYQDTESLRKFGPTLLGAGLTNRPFIKGMEPVVPLSEGDSVQVMSPEEMTKALQAMQAAIEKLLAAKDPAPKADLETGEELPSGEPGDVPPPADPKEGDVPPPEDKVSKEGESMNDAEKKKFSDMETALADATKKCAELEKKVSDKEADVAAAEMKKQFDVMLTEGKAVEAQRDPFMKKDFAAFAKAAGPLPKATKLSLSEEQAGGKNIDAPVDPAKEILKLAEKAVADKKAPDLIAAQSMVLADPANKALRESYEKKSYNRAFAAESEE